MLFAELLASIATPEDRTLAESLAAKYPVLNQAVMRQDEFSRRLDSFRKVEEAVDSWNNWANENWDEESKMTKAELAYRNRIQELEAEKATQVDFDQLNQTLSKFVTDNKLVSHDDLSRKEMDIANELRGHAYLTAQLTMLGQKHMLDYGKVFDAPGFLQKVNSYGTNNLEQAYEMHTREERAAKEKEKYEKQVAEIKQQAEAEARKKIAEEYGQRSNGSHLPNDEHGSQGASPFMKQYMKAAENGGPSTGLEDAGFAAAQAYRQEKLGVSQ